MNITDAAGRLVFTKDISGVLQYSSSSSLTTGVYVISINEDGIRYYKKLVVK